MLFAGCCFSLIHSCSWQARSNLDSRLRCCAYCHLGHLTGVQDPADYGPGYGFRQCACGQWYCRDCLLDNEDRLRDILFDNEEEGSGFACDYCGECFGDDESLSEGSVECAF